MPQGKGTYGKKKGRPPKKMMAGGAGAGAATKAIAKGAKSLLKGKPTFTRAQLKSLTKKKK